MIDRIVQNLNTYIASNINTYCTQVGVPTIDSSNVVYGIPDFEKNQKSVLFFYLIGPETDAPLSTQSKTVEAELTFYIVVRGDTLSNLNTKCMSYGSAFEKLLRADLTLAGSVFNSIITEKEYSSDEKAYKIVVKITDEELL